MFDRLVRKATRKVIEPVKEEIKSSVAKKMSFNTSPMIKIGLIALCLLGGLLCKQAASTTVYNITINNFY